MSRLLGVIVLVGIIFVAGYVLMNYNINVQRDEKGNLQLATVTPREPDANPASPSAAGNSPTTPDADPAPVNPAEICPPIRIASFDATRLDEAKLANRQVADVLARLVPKFDLVAVQDIRASNQGVLVRLIEQINTTSGRKFRFASAPNAGIPPNEQYCAFIFDDAKIAIDHTLAYSVQDPAGLFRHVPIVAAFRARGPEPNQAFTFKLINVHIDRDRAFELDSLDDVYRAVRGEGSNEDDIIMLGNFGVENSGPGDERLGQLGAILDITSAVTDTPTTPRSRKPIDNILFDRRATSEFTGRADVMDLMREFDLTLRESLEVSDHQPVWAEFSPYEGGQSGHVAEGDGPTTR